MRISIPVRTWALLAVALTWLASGTAVRADELDVLKGRTVRAVIGASPGNATDSALRIFLGTLRKILPDTTFRIQNINAAGGAAALRDVQDSRGDVITVVGISNGPIYAHFTADEVPYNLASLKWIGSINDNQRVLFARKGAATTFAALRTLGRQPIAPASDATSVSTQESYLISAMTGIRLKVVPGISDAVRDTMFVSGDVDVLSSNPAARRAMVDAGILVPVLRLGDGAYSDEVNRLPKLGDVALPTVPADLVFFMESLNRLGGLVAAAPATAASDVAALRVAFDRVVAHPDFKSETVATMQVLGQPAPGAHTEDIFRRLLADNGSRLKSIVKGHLTCGQKISDAPSTVCP